MSSKARRIERRAQPLSRAQIITAAIAILDADGERALTFRALADRLATGSGAIYWHISDKDELLTLAADHIVATAMAGVRDCADPRERIRTIALEVFAAVDAHPWVGTRMNREPWRPGILEVFEGLGGGLIALGVPETAQFDVWSALINYVLGVAAQNAANRVEGGSDRSAFLDKVAAHWERLDPGDHPFLRGLATRLREHDDREQFLAGIDLILAGIDGLRSGRTAGPRTA